MVKVCACLGQQNLSANIKHILRNAIGMDQPNRCVIAAARRMQLCPWNRKLKLRITGAALPCLIANDAVEFQAYSDAGVHAVGWREHAEL